MTSLKLLQPQEIEVWYGLPALRREIALSMKTQGLDHKTIANILGITNAAVSQYIHNKRAHETQLPESIKKEIREAAHRLAAHTTTIIPELQHLLKLLWNEGVICDLHKQKGSNLPTNCTLCKP